MIITLVLGKREQVSSSRFLFHLTFTGRVFVPGTVLETSREKQESALSIGKQRRSSDTSYKGRFRKGMGEKKNRVYQGNSGGVIMAR